jgi:hypothetical protein
MTPHKLLSEYTREELVLEISKRNGTISYVLPDKDQSYVLHIYGKHGVVLNFRGDPGPVDILVVKK